MQTKRERSNIVFKCESFEITKRELLVSISILAVLLLIGLLISEKISEYQMDLNEKYSKAVKIETQELFEYGMQTNIGNAFVYGELKAVDSVTYPEIGGEYMYIKKVKEQYTSHVRQVPYVTTVNGKTRTYFTTKIQHTWDEVKTEELQCSQISFQGVVFPVYKIQMPEKTYITTVQESSKIRYQYYGVRVKFTGTIFTELKDNTISDKTMFYNGRSIESTIERLEINYLIVLFWIVWSMFIFCCIFMFYYVDNRWLE